MSSSLLYVGKQVRSLMMSIIKHAIVLGTSQQSGTVYNHNQVFLLLSIFTGSNCSCGLSVYYSSYRYGSRPRIIVAFLCIWT